MDLEPVDQYTLEIKRKIFIAVIMVKTSLVTQTVKNLPTVQETGVRSLDGEDPLEKGMVTPTPVFLSGEFCRQRSLAGCSPWGRKESDITEPLTLSLSFHGKSRIQLGIKNWDFF